MQRVDDVRQMLDEIAQLARRGNDRETVLVQGAQDMIQLLVRGPDRRPGLAKHPRKSTVNRVGRPVGIGVNADPEIRPFRPMLPALGIDRVSLGFEAAHFGQREGNRSCPLHGFHRHVAPGSVGQLQLARVRVNDFPAQRFAAPQIGAQSRPPAFGQRAPAQAQTK